MPERIYRGEPLDVSALISNSGTAAAANVSAEWTLPEGFLLLDSDSTCTSILPGGGCTATARILAPQGSALEEKEIRIVVRYSE